MLIDCNENARWTYGVNEDVLILVCADGYVGLIAGGSNPQLVLDYLRQIIRH